MAADARGAAGAPEGADALDADAPEAADAADADGENSSSTGRRPEVRKFEGDVERLVRREDAT